MTNSKQVPAGECEFPKIAFALHLSPAVRSGLTWTHQIDSHQNNGLILGAYTAG